MQDGILDYALVGGIDSYFDPDVLEWLDAELRLHALEAENGFIPGEGAAFLLLSRRARTHGMRKLGAIHSAVIEDEPRAFGSEEPCHALALSWAIKRASGALENARRIGWALTDVANERHRVDEWQLAIGRCFRTFTADVVHDQPLLKTGDLGAASAATLATMACVHWEIGSAVSDLALIATHSDGPERGVMLFGREEES
jgi:3-oxoacyl-[acyl-carrier-protein] synthase I